MRIFRIRVHNTATAITISHNTVTVVRKLPESEGGEHSDPFPEGHANDPPVDADVRHLVVEFYVVDLRCSRVI
jgi:hypothetical protein